MKMLNCVPHLKDPVNKVSVYVDLPDISIGITVSKLTKNVHEMSSTQHGVNATLSPWQQTCRNCKPPL